METAPELPNLHGCGNIVGLAADAAIRGRHRIVMLLESLPWETFKWRTTLILQQLHLAYCSRGRSCHYATYTVYVYAYVHAYVCTKIHIGVYACLMREHRHPIIHALIPIFWQVNNTALSHLHFRLLHNPTPVGMMFGVLLHVLLSLQPRSCSCARS